MDDQFFKLGREIRRAAEKVLSPDGLADLKSTIHTAMDQVTDVTRSTIGAAMGHGERRQWPKPPGGDPIFPLREPASSAYRRRSLFAPKAVTSLLLAILGVIFAFPAGVLLMISLIMALTGHFSEVPMEVNAVSLVWFALFGGLAYQGISGRRRARRFDRYQGVIRDRLFCQIAELAAATGLSREFVVKDLKKMLRLGMFKEGYLDDEGSCFMLSYDTYRQYLQTREDTLRRQQAQRSREEEMKKDPEQAAFYELLEEGERYIRRIKEANIALPEEEISLCLDRLEEVTTKIFGYVKQHPEKRAQIRKFMCYYLPTTLKLVEAYRELDTQAVDTQNISQTKAEIKGALGNIHLAFQNLLEKLMENDLMDLSADISALETILTQEGLTDKQDFPAGFS